MSDPEPFYRPSSFACGALFKLWSPLASLAVIVALFALSASRAACAWSGHRSSSSWCRVLVVSRWSRERERARIIRDYGDRWPGARRASLSPLHALQSGAGFVI